MDLRVQTISSTVDKKPSADLEQALTIAGFGSYNIKYCFVLALFLVAAILEPTGYSYVLPASKCDLNMSDAQRGFISSVPFIGIVLTSYPWGYLVDTRGRKKIIIISSLAAGFFGIVSALMPEIISFTILKMFTSLCIAGPAAIPYSYIGEITPQRYRDTTLSVTNAFQITGSAFVPLLAWAVLPLDFRADFGLYEFRPWRLLAMLNTTVFIISAVLLSFGPESPKYLVSQGKHDEALKVLQTIYAKNKGKRPEDYPVQKLIMPPANDSKRSFVTALKEQSLPLFKPPLLKWMALIGFLLFGIFATLNGLYVWVPDILNRVLAGSGQGLTACEVISQRLNETSDASICVDEIEISTFQINAVANFSCALIALAASSLVRFVGKRFLMVLMYLLIGSFCISINFTTNDILFAVMLSSFPLAGLTLGPVNAYAVDTFPTYLRGMAISLAMMFGRVGSVVGANLAGILINNACEATFFTFGGLLVLCGFLSFLLPWKKTPETTEPNQDKIATRM